MKHTRITVVLFIGLGVGLLSGCRTSERQLARVAKDWCLTIRSSQVLPVYPLTEDLQPGDVFVVQTPLSAQARIYRRQGFLALDQHVTRLGNLPYDTFYAGGYWEGTYAGVPHVRPGWSSGDAPPVPRVPRAAFPTYNFSVQRSGGLKLAIPIQGVPVGLGWMGAQHAAGSVTLTDTFTYGLDIEPMLRALVSWWRENPDVRDMLGAVAAESSEPVFLRVVNRVYLAGGVRVQLTNLDSQRADAEAGVPPDFPLSELSELEASGAIATNPADPSELDTLTAGLRLLQGAAPGGAARFVQASRSSVTLDQTFDRPLVIGYLGFDVKVYEDGTLSPPIPSYAVLNRQLDWQPGAKLEWSDDEGLSDRYLEWLRGSGNRVRMEEWLRAQELSDDPGDLIGSSEHQELLGQAARQFGF
ncbi:MAG: hypothetical protein MUC91_00750 [Verrucomicrobia bacterium]|nr:hypothetical protein [Verrucomicrobiota bacterium]